MFLLVLAHLGSPRQRAVKRSLLLLSMKYVVVMHLSHYFIYCRFLSFSATKSFVWLVAQHSRIKPTLRE